MWERLYLLKRKTTIRTTSFFEVNRHMHQRMQKLWHKKMLTYANLHAPYKYNYNFYNNNTMALHSNLYLLQLCKMPCNFHSIPFPVACINMPLHSEIRL